MNAWLVGDKPITCNGLDPRKLGEDPRFKDFVDDTKIKYLATWDQFLDRYDVKLGNPPTYGMVYHYFEFKFHNKYSASTITSMYSHLQSGFTRIYGRSLGERKAIFE